MKTMKTYLILALVALGSSACGSDDESPGQASAGQANAVGLTKYEMIVHDPVMIEENGVYYLFTTGPGVTVWSSRDLLHWDRQDPVFDPAPPWAKREVEGFNGHIWAPDISYHDGQFYLYYSISSFGKNDSCIGLATNATLDPESADFQWVDRGIVVQSLPGAHNWNAIDPNLVEDENGVPYLSFGSFWSGLQIGRLNESRDAFADGLESLVTIASRNPGPTGPVPEEGYPVEAGNGAIEAPSIARRGDFYYLFASTGYCCRGKDSTYRMVYGRSESVLGPYLDKDGVDMAQGGGTLLLGGDERWHGVGHNAVVQFDGVDYVVFHGYDGDTERGLPKLHVEVLHWDEDGWPYVER